jgi:hypothetical protein
VPGGLLNVKSCAKAHKADEYKIKDHKIVSRK